MTFLMLIQMLYHSVVKPLEVDQKEKKKKAEKMQYINFYMKTLNKQKNESNSHSCEIN